MANIDTIKLQDSGAVQPGSRRLELQPVQAPHALPSTATSAHGRLQTSGSLIDDPMGSEPVCKKRWPIPQHRLQHLLRRSIDNAAECVCWQPVFCIWVSKLLPGHTCCCSSAVLTGWHNGRAHAACICISMGRNRAECNAHELRAVGTERCRQAMLKAPLFRFMVLPVEFRALDLAHCSVSLLPFPWPCTWSCLLQAAELSLSLLLQIRSTVALAFD